MHACWEVTCFDVNFRKFGKATRLDGCRISSTIAGSSFLFIVKLEVDFRSGLRLSSKTHFVDSRCFHHVDNWYHKHNSNRQKLLVVMLGQKTRYLNIVSKIGKMWSCTHCMNSTWPWDPLSQFPYFRISTPQLTSAKPVLRESAFRLNSVFIMTGEF